MTLGQHTEAIGKYRKANEIEPRNPGIYYNWGNSLMAVNRDEAAIEKFRSKRCKHFLAD